MYHQFQRAEPKKTKNVTRKNIKTKLKTIFEDLCHQENCQNKKGKSCSDYNATRANIIDSFNTLKLPATLPKISLILPLPEMEGKINKSGFLMTKINIRFQKKIVTQRQKKETSNTYVSKTIHEPITTEEDIKNKLIFIVGLLKKHYKIN